MDTSVQYVYMSLFLSFVVLSLSPQKVSCPVWQLTLTLTLSLRLGERQLFISLG